MSTAFSKKMQSTATRLLGKYGSTVTLVRAGETTWDPVLGEDVTGPDTLIPLTSVPVPVSLGLIDGTAIQAGDMVTKADYSVMPTQKDKVQFRGEQWSVVGVDPKLVNDDIIAWFIRIRK